MLEDVSFDGTNDKLIWGTIFTGIGFALGMSCFLVQCLCRTCHKRRNRRPVVKVLGAEVSDDDTTSSAIEMTPEPVSDATTDDEAEEEEVEEKVEVVVDKDINERPSSPIIRVNISNAVDPSRPRGVIRLTNTVKK